MSAEKQREIRFVIRCDLGLKKVTLIAALTPCSINYLAGYWLKL